MKDGGVDVWKTYGFFERNRRLISAVFVLAGLPLVLFIRHGWTEGGPVDNAFDYGGAVLIIAGMAGRIWSAMYIVGRKNAQLVQDGPYSMCRNPLYFFSFIAGLGVCVELENLLVIFLYLALFSFYYTVVIRSEEKRLELLFGDELRAYKERVPAFLPNPFTFHAGERAPAQPRRMFKTLMDGSLFLLFIPLACLIERLQASGVLHTFWRIP